MANRPGSDIGFEVTRTILPGSAAGPGAAGPDAGPAIVFPEVFVPPDGAQYFTLQSEADTAAIEVIVFPENLFVPPRHQGVINTVQFFSDNADATLVGFTFALLVGGATVPGFDALTIPRLGGAQGVNISPAFVRVGANLLIASRFNNALGGAHHVGAFIQGWFWPSTKGA